MSPPAPSTPTSPSAGTGTPQSYSLVRPSSTVPWSADVVSVAPSILMETLDKDHHPSSATSLSQQRLTAPDKLSRVVASTSKDRWQAVAIADSQQQSTTTQPSLYVIHVWQSLCPTKSTLEEQKKSRLVLTLRHPKLLVPPTCNNNTTTPPLLLSIEIVKDAAFLYVAHATTGVVWLWKLTGQDFARGLAPPNRVMLPLDLEEEEDDEVDALATAGDEEIDSSATKSSSSFLSGKGECLSNLTTYWTSASPVVLVGTTYGNVYLLRQTHSPIGLQPTLLGNIHAGGSASQKGLLSRLWTNVSTSVTSSLLPVVFSSKNRATAIVTSLIESDTDFYILAQQGRLVHWSLLCKGQKVDFALNYDFDLLTAIRGSVIDPPVESLQVLAASIGRSGQGNPSTLHVLVLIKHRFEEKRIYWLRLAKSSPSEEEPPLVVQSSTWLNRFVSPENVSVKGMIVAENQLAYAAFEQHPSLPNVFMVLDDKVENHVHELDLPVVQVGRLLATTQDTVTHGCSVWTTSGLGLRIRKIQTAIRQTSSDVEASPGMGAVNPSTLQTLVSHLRSTFRVSYDNPSRPAEMPKSLTMAATDDLEAAVRTFAKQLQRERNASAQNLMDWHSALVNMLLEAGLYRRLGLSCRWDLLTMGQEIAVFKAIRTRTAMDSFEQEWLNEVTADRVAQSLSKLQQDTIGAYGGEVRQERFLELLALALREAMVYRENRLAIPYDISSDELPIVSSIDNVPAWTSHPSMCTVLKEQVKQLKHTRSTAPAEVIEIVVDATVAIFADVYSSCPTQDTERNYARIQEEAIPLVRRLLGPKGDQQAFQLSVQHKYFAGICQIALDHEKKADYDEYSLDPLFLQLEGQVGVTNSLAFAPFVLKFHSDRRLFGHALRYGERCPEALNLLLQHDKSIKHYLWIHAIRNGDYDGAASSLLQNASSNLPLSRVKVDLAIASIANHIVQAESLTLRDGAKRRRIDIEHKRELAGVQVSLYEDPTEAGKAPLETPERLLSLAMTKFAKSTDREGKAEAAIKGLVICTTLPNDGQVQAMAAKVWAMIIQEDTQEGTMLRQQVLSKTEPTVMPESSLTSAIKEDTVFGNVVQQCRDQFSSSFAGKVGYERVESQVCQHLGLDQLSLSELRRALRRAAAGDDALEQILAH